VVRAISIVLRWWSVRRWRPYQAAERQVCCGVQHDYCSGSGHTRKAWVSSRWGLGRARPFGGRGTGPWRAGRRARWRRTRHSGRRLLPPRLLVSDVRHRDTL